MSNLSPQQFNQKPNKKRWVPDQHGHSIGWHILKWHIKGAGPSNAKHFGGDGILSHDYVHHQKIHMRMHEDGKFEVDHEHEHFTPKDKQ